VQIIEKYLPNQLTRKIEHIQLPSQIPVSKIGHVRPQPGHVQATQFLSALWTYPGSLSDSSKDYRTYSAPGPDMSSLAKSSQRLSPSWTYPAEQPYSRGRPRTYPVPGPNMSGSSALTRVRPLHRTCLVPRLGSREGCRTCLTPSPIMSGSLTPQWVDSF
jgi:hypothetical protein